MVLNKGYDIIKYRVFWFKKKIYIISNLEAEIEVLEDVLEGFRGRRYGARRNTWEIVLEIDDFWKGHKIKLWPKH